MEGEEGLLRGFHGAHIVGSRFVESLGEEIVELVCERNGRARTLVVRAGSDVYGHYEGLDVYEKTASGPTD